MRVPGFLLRRLYVKHSLRSTDDGFEFQLHNSLGSGYAHTMLPLTVDGQDIPLEQTTFQTDGTAHTFAEVSRDTPFTLAVRKTTTVQVHGRHLEPMPHRIGMRFVVAGMGELGFEFTDEPDWTT